jgi:hypothetical protein
MAPGAQVGRILRASYSGQLKYPKVTLSKNGHELAHTVHTLIARAFIGPPPTPAHEVNHKDGLHQNSILPNVEWMTRSENQQHAHALKRAR